MKVLFSILAFCSLHVYAVERPFSSELLRCLGEEERTFHLRKQTGSLYDLNQRLIGELVQITRIDAPPTLLRKICGGKSSPSLGLLEAMMLTPQKWAAPRSGGNAMEDSIAKELVKDLEQGVPELLLNYISALQAEAPSAQCLNKHIPGLNSLNNEVKYLQEDMDMSKIAGKKKRLASLFKSFKQSEQIFAQCRKEDLQSKEKSKKSDKGSGKPSAQ